MRRPLTPLLLALLALTARAGDEPAPAPPPVQGKKEGSTAGKEIDRAADVKARCAYAGGEFEMDASPATPLGETVLVEQLSYPSPVTSVDPERNDRVRARLFHTEKPEKAVVVVLGGWRFDPFTPNVARQIAETGLQALYVEIPFQERRTPRGKRPGEVTLSADLDQTEATFVQLAQDVARGLDWLVRERGIDPERIGILGTSLGGFAASTIFGVRGDMKACVSFLSGADVASVLFNGNWLTAQIRAELDEKGIDEQQVRARLRGIDPGTWADRARKDALLLVAAELDDIVPLANIRKLAKLYGDARLEIVEGVGHMSPKEIGTKVPDAIEHLKTRLLPAKDPAADPGADPEKGAGGDDHEDGDGTDSPR